MSAAAASPNGPTARFLVIYDTPTDIEAFERHYNEVHIPLAKQYPGLRRYIRSHDPAVMLGEPVYMVAMLDWDDIGSLGAALESDAGQRTGEDAMTNLAPLASFRAMILQLEEV